MPADILFIVNPVSGKKNRKARILSLLESSGGRIALTEYPGHAEILARESKESIVVAVGGDGTVNEVARGLLGTGKTMGIIPCGSGDGLALDLGISRNIRKALGTVMNGKLRTIDSGIIDGHRFFSTCGIGLDAEVSRRFASSTKRGLATYIRDAFSVWHGFNPEKIEIDVDGETFDCYPVLISVCNSGQWGNDARIAPEASPDDGLLDVMVVDMFQSVEIPVLASRLMTGRLLGSSEVHMFRGRNISIRRQSEGPAHFDGDCFTGGKCIEISIVPGSLNVLVPQDSFSTGGQSAKREPR